MSGVTTFRRRVWVFGVLGLALASTVSCRRPAETTLQPGDTVPALVAQAHDGTTVDLRSLAGRPFLVFFYPKDGTPGCTKEACAIRDIWDKYAEAGVQVIGVSTDDLDSHRKFADEHALPFPLVSDPDFRWAEAFGVATTVGIHHRDSFLIGRDGNLHKVYRGVDPGVHADEVLRDVAKLPSPS